MSFPNLHKLHRGHDGSSLKDSTPSLPSLASADDDVSLSPVSPLLRYSWSRLPPAQPSPSEYPFEFGKTSSTLEDLVGDELQKSFPSGTGDNFVSNDMPPLGGIADRRFILQPRSFPDNSGKKSNSEGKPSLCWDRKTSSTLEDTATVVSKET